MRHKTSRAFGAAGKGSPERHERYIGSRISPKLKILRNEEKRTMSSNNSKLINTETGPLDRRSFLKLSALSTALPRRPAW